MPINKGRLEEEKGKSLLEVILIKRDRGDFNKPSSEPKVEMHYKKKVRDPKEGE